MSTTPFVPGWRPWLHEALAVPGPALPEAPPLALALLAGAVAAAVAAAVVPGWLAATGLLPPEAAHPAMVSTTAVSSVATETAEVVRDIWFSSFRSRPRTARPWGGTGGRDRPAGGSSWSRLSFTIRS
jgi:hypothetical protein